MNIMMHIMTRKEFTSIPVERPQMEQLQAVKAQLQDGAGRPLRWGDVFTALLAIREQAMANVPEPESAMVAHMAQDDERALTPEELEAMGVVEVPGLPITLSDEDRDRIAELVVDKLLKRLPGLADDEFRRKT